MQNLEIIIAAMFISIAGLNARASWLGIPYPIPLVLGGLALALVPGLPNIELDLEEARLDVSSDGSSADGG